MEDKHSHLIERAAARLSQTSATPPARAKLAQGPNKPMERDLSAPVREPDVNVTKTDQRPPPIASDALLSAGFVRDSDSRVAEEFRIIQNRVLRQSFTINGGREPRVSSNLIMITSALKGEGKSFVSINLAGEIARQGDRRVLLMDTDPKPHRLSHKLGVSSGRGLLDLVRDGGLAVSEVIIPTAAENLDVLPFGRNTDGSVELLASRRLGEVIEDIGRRYADRLIIIDAPPCLASSAPHSLAEVCGQAVLVVAANSTQQGDVEAALDLLQVCPEVSLLLNKVAPWMTHSFGTYSYSAQEG
jgi:protein-tyrosine kinase